jgi:hypothetical protein
VISFSAAGVVGMDHEHDATHMRPHNRGVGYRKGGGAIDEHDVARLFEITDEFGEPR